MDRQVQFVVFVIFMFVGPTSSAGTEVTDAQFNVTCDASYMMTITFSARPDLRERLWVDDTDVHNTTGERLNLCAVTTNGDVFSLSVNMSAEVGDNTTCPPNVVQLDQTNTDIYEKYVIVTEGTSNLFVGANVSHPGSLSRWGVRCEYQSARNETVTLLGNASVSMQPGDLNDGGHGGLPQGTLTMKILPTADLSPSNTQSEYLTTIRATDNIQVSTLNQQLTMAVYVTDANNYWEFITVKSCLASNTAFFGDNVNTAEVNDTIEIVSQKCPRTDLETNLFAGGVFSYYGAPTQNSHQVYTTETTFRLDFTSFRINNMQTVWFRCDVEVCPETWANTKCPKPSPLTTDGTCQPPSVSPRSARSSRNTLFSARRSDASQLVTIQARLAVTDGTPSGPDELHGMSPAAFVATIAVTTLLTTVGVVSLVALIVSYKKSVAGSMSLELVADSGNQNVEPVGLDNRGMELT